MAASLSACARRFDYVREVGPNTGAWVSLFQRFTGNLPGASWCASFVCFIADVAYLGASPLKPVVAKWLGASCPALLAFARTQNWVVATPQVDDLFFYLNSAGVAHHVGIVTGVNPLVGVAGNTSADGRSPNGTGVFEHTISASVFVRLPQ